MKKFAALSAILAIALALRFFVFHQYELWFDEAYSGLTVFSSWSDMFQIIVNDVHPPLYYVLLKMWVTLFGNTVFTIRAMSILFSVCSILLVYAYVNREMNSQRAGYIAALAMAVNPFFVDYGVEARQYSVLLCITLLALYSFTRAVRETPNQYSKWWLLFSVAVGAGFLTHYVFSLGILLFAAIILWRFLAEKSQSVGDFFKLQVRVWILPFIAFAAWFPVLYDQMTTKGGLHWVPEANYFDILRSFYAFFFGVYSHALGLPPVRELPFISTQLVGLVFGTVFVVTIYRSIQQRSEKTHLSVVLLAAFTIIPLSIVVFASRLGVHLYVERFLTPYAASFFLLMMVLYLKSRPKIQLGVGSAYLAVISAIFVTTYDKDNTFAPIQEYCMQHTCDRVLFSDPGIYVEGTYYVKDITQQHPQLVVTDMNKMDEYASWSIIDREYIVLFDDLREETDIFFAADDLNDERFQKVSQLEGQFDAYVPLNRNAK